MLGRDHWSLSLVWIDRYNVVSGYYRYTITIFAGNGEIDRFLKGFEADQYYYELFGKSYTAASLSIVS